MFNLAIATATSIDFAGIEYDPETGYVFKNGKKIGSYTRKYGRFLVNNKHVTISRYAVYFMTGKWPEDEVDHINGDTHDDRWCNLRECSRTENAQNKVVRVTNKLGYKGVYPMKYRNEIRYVASIQTNKKRTYLGSFRAVEDAIEAYNTAATELHKQFARIN